MLLTDIKLLEKLKTNDIIVLKCDYCKNDFTRQFSNHLIIAEKENHIIDRDACNDCRQDKAKEVRDVKQSKGLLNMYDFGYWQYKDNILRELDKFIVSKGSLQHMQKDEEFYGRRIWNASKNAGYHPFYLAKELGYQLAELTNHRPFGYYDNIENVKEEIEYLVDKLGRFPTAPELTKVAMNANIVKKLGGMRQLRVLIGHENDLLDDSGYVNSSVYEYTVAQFLLQNGIPHKREVHPFPRIEGQFRSDFLIGFKNEDVYVEVWGYPLNPNCKRSVAYDKSKRKKLSLYKKHNINLIEIESTLFSGTYENIIKELNELFHLLLCNKNEINDVDLERVISNNKMSDEEIILFIQNQIPQLEEGVLPTGTFLQNNFRWLFEEIRKRHGTYITFLDKFGYVTNKKSMTIWDKKRVFTIFLYCLSKYGKILTFPEMRAYKEKDKKLIGLDGGINTNGGLINLKLEFFKEYSQEVNK